MKHATTTLLLGFTALFSGIPLFADPPEQLLADNTDGQYGFYLKEVSGPVLANLNENQIFEPASSIKVLIHLQGMMDVENGVRDLTDVVPWLADAGKFDAMGNYLCGDNDCYAGNNVLMADPLQECLRLMMECSDNALTQVLRNLLGDANIATTAYSTLGLDMNAVQLNHSIGCGADAVANHNRLALAEVGKLHEIVATTPLLGPANRQTFYDLMVNGRFFDFVIANEGALSGLSASQIADYRSLVQVASKGGSYGLSDGLYRSLAGWVQLPFPCSGGTKEYVFGAFIDGATTLDLQGTGAQLDIAVVAAEMFRDTIMLSLDSFACALPPELHLPPDLVLECTGPDGFPSSDPAIVAWLASASASDLCDELVSFEHTPLPDRLPTTCNGVSAIVTFTAIDLCGSVSEETRSIRIVDTTPPQITPPEPLILECNTVGGVSGDDPAIQAWYDSAAYEDLCSHISLRSHSAPAFFAAECPPGTPVEIKFTATDLCGNTAEAFSSITVVDTSPPELNCQVATDTLWSPNHSLVDIGLTITAIDMCDPDPKIEIVVTSDEHPAHATGSGSPAMCPDAIIGTDNSVQLRAERSGVGDGRVYEIKVTATDSCGNQSVRTIPISVPKSQFDGPATDSGQLFNPAACP